MSSIKRTSKLVTIAALAASTALSGPVSVLAQEQAVQRLRLAQADVPPVVLPEGEAPVVDEAPAVEEEAPEPEPEPEPVIEEPVVEEEAAPEPEPEPVLEEPAPEPEPEPVVEEPVVEEETAPEPEPVIEEPVLEEPVVEEPVIEEPVIEEPVIEEQATEEPVVDEPAVDEQVIEEPVVDEPVIEEPVLDETLADEPVVEESVDEPIVDEPAGEAGELLDETPADPAQEQSAPAEAPPSDAAPTTEEPADGGAPAGGEPVAPGDITTTPDGEVPADPEAAPTAPVDGAPAATETTPVPADPTIVPPVEGAAPADDPNAAAPADAAPATTLIAPPPPEEPPQPVSTEIQSIVPEAGQVAASDAQVQNIDQSITINSVTNIVGNRIEVAPEPVLPPQIEIVETTDDDREILTIVGAAAAGAVVGAAATLFIRSNDDERLRVDAQEFYVEELPRNQTRETIVRENGVQVVTIYDRYGEVVQRSRILPDGREVVLFYDPYENETEEPLYYYDVGAELPPIELVIPEEEYIVDVTEPDEDLYYRTIVAPPVETVERIYSVDEVRRSERIRDKVRRIDLATINFDFGSFSIPQEQVGNLQALADAIARVIDENPDETFLIEGHTDAVGSEIANLTLSDRRAESVAQALTSFFDVPPENLVTQGYGEAYLKVDTQEEAVENRRVTVRRITALVKPVESASAN